jgi:hypothetical protein
MITHLEAIGKARDHIEKTTDLICEIIQDATIEKPFGWVFFYNSREFLETGDLSFALTGNAPIIVDKFTGLITETGTAYPIEYYIENYTKLR